MINELKDLIEAVSHLPQYVMWCLVGFLFYKLFVIGNVYAIIRLGINKLYDYATREKIIKYKFNGLWISHSVTDDLEKFLAEVLRHSDKQQRELTLKTAQQLGPSAIQLLGMGMSSGSSMFSYPEISKLKEAWELYLKNENEK